MGARKPFEMPTINRTLDQQTKKPIQNPGNLRGISHRKFSIPVALHTTTNLLDPHSVLPASNRRRFSNVSEAVSRKFSNTIGWRTATTVPPRDIIMSGRTLCVLYIRSRLKRCGKYNRRIGLSRFRENVSESDATSDNIAKEVFPFLNIACIELERLYPKLYSNITRQLSLPPLTSEKVDIDMGEVLLAIAHQLFRVVGEPTWGKIISLYSIAGGLAIECLKLSDSSQIQVEKMRQIVDAVTEIFEDKLAEWVIVNGGWAGLTNQCTQEKNQDVKFVEYSTIFVLMAGVLVVSYLLFTDRKSVV